MVDILLTGRFTSGGGGLMSEIWDNTDGFTPNAPPAAPTSLTASAVTDTSATLAWNAPADDTTPA